MCKGVETREDLEQLLAEAAEVDEKDYISAEQIWTEMDEYIKNAKTKRRRSHAKYPRRDMTGLLKTRFKWWVRGRGG